MWRRTWEMSKGYSDFEYGSDLYVLNCLKKNTRHYRLFQKRVSGYLKNEHFDGHIAGTEFFLSLSVYGQNQLQIIPKYNMISNIGCTNNSAHADELNTLPLAVRKLFNAKTYEIEFPLKETKYVIPDFEYEKKRNRIVAQNHPILDFGRNIQRSVLIIKYQGWSNVISRIIKRLENKTARGITEK
jgi:hypothetical protein